MVKFGWVRRVIDKALQLHECLRVFAVSRVSAWRVQYQQPVAAYRAAPTLTRTLTQSPPGCGRVNAWLGNSDAARSTSPALKQR